ncbi:MAG: ATP-binding protein [Inhella sp.]
MRLTHQLALTLLATTLLAVAAMGGFMAFHLQQGFSDYLATQDRQRLTAFAGAARAAIERHGLEGLRQQPERLRPPGQDGSEPPPEAGPPPRGRPPREREMRYGPPGEPPPPPGADPERERARRGLTLHTPEGELLWGRSPPPGRQQLEEPVVLNGQTVALARLVPRPEAPEVLDQRFLRRQLLGILGVGLLVAALAAALAWRLAGRWLRPLAEVQGASHRLAQGDFAVRLPRRNAPTRNEFDALVDDVNHLAEALQGLEASRRRWLAELSHELRTPLTVLRGELDAVRDGVRPLNSARLESLSTEVNRLRRLADDFHHLALADLQALPCEPLPLDPGALLQQLAERHRPALEAAGLRLELALQPLPDRVRWDGERIVQVLDNLFANARAYTDAPGQLRLSAAHEGAGVRITLDDSPPGVPPALLPRLFDPLFRADPARQRGQGSGLGLSIARAWVQRHGGQIDASPSPLGGLRVSLWLPERQP